MDLKEENNQPSSFDNKINETPDISYVNEHHTNIGLKSADIETDTGHTKIAWDISPKVNFNELKSGDIVGAVGNTTLGLTFGQTFTQDDIEIQIKVNGNLHTILNSPSNTKNFSASFSATKRFNS